MEGWEWALITQCIIQCMGGWGGCMGGWGVFTDHPVHYNDLQYLNNEFFVIVILFICVILFFSEKYLIET